jgi:hypothetical protein
MADSWYSDVVSSLSARVLCSALMLAMFVYNKVGLLYILCIINNNVVC